MFNKVILVIGLFVLGACSDETTVDVQFNLPLPSQFPIDAVSCLQPGNLDGLKARLWVSGHTRSELDGAYCELEVDASTLEVTGVCPEVTAATERFFAIEYYVEPMTILGYLVSYLDFTGNLLATGTETVNLDMDSVGIFVSNMYDIVHELKDRGQINVSAPGMTPLDRASAWLRHDVIGCQVGSDCEPQRLILDADGDSCANLGELCASSDGKLDGGSNSEPCDANTL
ncbi:MAG: hypothetical protein VYA34_00540 [Myxococcota bacterium]|nr:hypothetical protein [Myxococcota bacterium]